MPLNSLIPDSDLDTEPKELIRQEPRSGRRTVAPNRARQKIWEITPGDEERLSQISRSFASRQTAPTEQPKTDKPLGLMGTIREGAKGTLRSLGATVDTAQGDAEGVVKAAQDQAAAPKDPDLEKFYAHIDEQKKALGENPSLWEGIKAVGSAAVDNPRGFGLMVAEQLPNSAAALGAGAAGALAGSLAGPAGTVIGGLAGLASANIGLETGSKALEAAQDGAYTPEEQSRARREGLVKGGVITGVDAATLGVTKWITGTTRRAVERATIKTLSDKGIDVTNAAARKAAMETPEIADAVKSAQELAQKSATTLGKRLARTGGAAALETIGEGAGEYLGEMAATGKANTVDAVIEGFAGLGTSIGEIAATGAMNRKGLQRLFDNPEEAEKTAEEETKATGVPHETIKSPTEPDKYVAVPKTRSVGGIELTRDEEGNLKPAAPLSTQADFNLANKPGFDLTAEDKLREAQLTKEREDAYAKNPLIVPDSAKPKGPLIGSQPASQVSNNVLLYTASRGSARAKQIATDEIERRKKEGIDPAIANAPETPVGEMNRIIETGKDKAKEGSKTAQPILTPTSAPKTQPAPIESTRKVIPEAKKPAATPKVQKQPVPAKPVKIETPAQKEVMKNEVPIASTKPETKVTIPKPVKGIAAQATQPTANPVPAQDIQKSGEITHQRLKAGESEVKIREAVQGIKGMTLGKWHPITVTHNGVTQHMLANQKREGGNGPGAVTLVHVKHGHLAKGLKETHVETTYKLTKNKLLERVGLPREASASTMEEWKNSGLPINPKIPTPNAEGTGGAAPKAEPRKRGDTDTLRPHIESLIKRRAAAKQSGKERSINTVINRAKEVMAGTRTDTTLESKWFRNQSKAMGRADPDTAAILNQISEAVKATPAKKETPKFSRRKPTKEGRSYTEAKQVHDIANEITRQWKNAPQVLILRTMADAPAAVKEENERQLSLGATGEPEAFVHGNEVYIVADQMKSPGDVLRVLMHESLGHFGLRGLYGEGLTPILHKVSALRRKDVNAKAKQYGLDAAKESDRLIAAEEVLAEMAQGNPQNNLVRRAIAAIAKWLRQNIPGFQKLRLTDSEIIENFLIPAREFVTDGAKPASKAGPANVVFSRSGAPATTPFRDRIDKIADTLIYNFQDRFKPLKDIQNRAGPVPETEDAALAEERYSGIVRARTDAFEEQLRDPLLKAIHNSKVAYEDVEEYLHALHAPSRNAAMREINPTEAELKSQTAAAEQQRDSLAKDPNVKDFLRLRRELRQAEADIEDGIADESLAVGLKSDIAQVRRNLNVRDYTQAIDKLKGLRLVKPFQGDNTALSGMSDKEAADIIAKADKNGTRAALDKISSIVDTITQRTRQIYVDSGLEKSDAIEAWNKKYEHYVPLHRDEVSGNTMPRIGQGFNIRGKESKRATGSTKEVTNILAHVVAQHEAAIIRSEKARVDQTLFRFATTHPDPSLWTLDTAPMIRMPDPLTGFVVERVDPTYKQRPEVLTMKIDGEEHTITFTESNQEAMRLAASMKNMNTEQMGEVTAMVGKFTRFLAMANTSANPVFTARNFLRDLQTAYINLSDTELADKKRQVFGDVRAAIKGMWDLSRGKHSSQWAKYAEEFKAAGGQTGWMEHYKDIGDRADKLKKELEAMGPGRAKMAWRTTKSWWEMVQDANNAVENGVRLSAYVNARKSGLSEGKAAQLAKNLTVNFNTRGAKSVELNAWYMFMNASIQGTARLFKALSNKQVQKIVAGVILSGFLMDILARSLAGDDDKDGENDYDQLPEHVKAMNFIFMVNNRPVTIPMPYGYNFFASTGRKLSEVMFRENYSAVKSAADLAGIFIDAFSPTGQAGSGLQYVAPTVADPFIQWAENKNFAGNPLRKPQNPFGVPNPEYLQGFKSNSAAGKWLAEMLNETTGGNEVRPGFINVNPALFDFAVSSIAGGAGRTYLQVASGPIKMAKDDDIQAKEVPFLNIFLGAKPEHQTERKYFEALKSVELAAKELKDYKAKGDTEMVKQIREDHGKEIRLAIAAKETKALLTRLRKQEQTLDKNDPPNKKELKKAIEERRKAAMSKFNSQYRKAVTAE